MANRRLYMYAMDEMAQQRIWVPKGARVVDLVVKYNRPRLVVEADDNTACEPIVFKMYSPEGSAAPQNEIYIGSVVVKHGSQEEVILIYKGGVDGE